MPNYNKVLLMGNLTRDPELRFTTSGNPVTNLRIAINRVYTDGGGEKKEETCFVTVVVWGKQAESCAEYLSKGRPVFVEGRLRTRNIETEEGKGRNIVEIVAQRVQFLGGYRKDTESSETRSSSWVEEEPAGVTSTGEKGDAEEIEKPKPEEAEES